MIGMDDRTLYDRAGGSDAMLRLAAAWHRRCLDDEILRHPFSHPGGHPDHVARLAAYWGEALGGPALYTSGMGDESFVARLHAGNGEHVDLDRRAVVAFEKALQDADIPDEGALRATLTDYFAAATTRLAQHPDSAATVPDGLPLPHWSSTDGADRTPRPA